MFVKNLFAFALISNLYTGVLVRICQFVQIQQTQIRRFTLEKST